MAQECEETKHRERYMEGDQNVQQRTEKYQGRYMEGDQNAQQRTEKYQERYMERDQNVQQRTEKYQERAQDIQQRQQIMLEKIQEKTQTAQMIQQKTQIAQMAQQKTQMAQMTQQKTQIQTQQQTQHHSQQKTQQMTQQHTQQKTQIQTQQKTQIQTQQMKQQQTQHHSQENTHPEKQKKYKIITDFEEDAPHGNIVYCTISFLSPEKMEKTKYLKTRGFKVHNGYSNIASGQDDIRKIKNKNSNHDVFMAHIGKAHAWDDTSRTDNVQYDNEKLNDFEKNRREHADKLKLMKEQFVNEFKYNVPVSNKLEARLERMRKKIYEKGLITKKQYESMNEEEKPEKNAPVKIEKMLEEIEECDKNDYLDVNTPVAFKFGCITIYSPKYIGGLKMLCFKINGLFVTEGQLQRRVERLKKTNPDIRMYTFEVGKWIPYTELDEMGSDIMLKELNYLMKCHLDHIKNEEVEFEKRRNEMQKCTEQESKMTKGKNRREKRKQNAKGGNVQKEDKDTRGTKEISSGNKNTVTERTMSMGNAEDDEAIRKIYEFLEDQELKNKYVSDASTLKTMTMNVS